MQIVDREAAVWCNRKPPFIGPIGNSRQNFRAKFATFPFYAVRNCIFPKGFLLFEIPVKIKKKVCNCQWVPRFVLLP